MFSWTSESWDKASLTQSLLHMVGSQIIIIIIRNGPKYSKTAFVSGFARTKSRCVLSGRRAACAAVRGATPRWWPRTASWTTAPGPPACPTATRRPTWRPGALGGSSPARLRPRTCSASGPCDPSAQVLQHETGCDSVKVFRFCVDVVSLADLLTNSLTFNQDWSHVGLNNLRI